LFWSEWDWEGARKELNLAIDINPGYANAHQYYSEFFEILCRKNEAQEQINLAISLDPLSSVMHYLCGRYYYNEGKYLESLTELNKVLEINPEYNAVYEMRLLIYLQQGEEAKAVETLQMIMLSDTSTVKYSNTVKEIYRKSGINGLLNLIVGLKLKNPDPWALATGYALLKNKEETLTWLEKAFEERTPNIPRLNSEPAFNYLRSDQRFKSLLNKMGLSEYENLN
jgi:tetratricopeptide (TPR) repeat protein